MKPEAMATSYSSSSTGVINRPAAHVARRVAAIRQAERLSESKAAFDAYRHLTFTSHTDEDGTLVFEGRLPADQGALLLRALDRAMDWLVRGASLTDRSCVHNASVPDVRQTIKSARRDLEQLRQTRRVVAVCLSQCVGVVAQNMENPEGQNGPAHVIEKSNVHPLDERDDFLRPRLAPEVGGAAGAALDEPDNEHARLGV